MVIKYYEDTTDTNSRYRKLRRLESDDNTVRIETADKVVFPENLGDTFYKVTPKDANRLDLISYRMYGTPLYWWAIAEASFIKDPFRVPTGTILRIPSPASLYSISGVLGDA